MNQEKTVELLEIEECKFRHIKAKIKSIRANSNSHIKNNPSCDEENYKGIREEARKTYYRNSDYCIFELEGLLESPTIENSLRVWKTLSKSQDFVLQAVYIPNKEFKKKNRYLLQFPSRIAHLLSKHAWIPNQEGVFFKPSEITLEEIHSDFIYDDSRYDWKYKIGLYDKETSEEVKEEQEQQKLKEEIERKEIAAKTLGFTMEEVEIFTKYKEILEKRIGKFVDIFEN